MRKVIAFVALGAFGGCSFATMHSPHGSPPECTDKQAAPFVDLVLTVATPFIVWAAVRANDSPSMDSTNTNDELGRNLADGLVTGLISTPVMAAFGTSSIYGFIKADRCFRAKRDYQQLMSAPPTPGEYVPPPISPGATGEPPPQAPLPMVPPAPPPPMPPQPTPAPQ